MSALYIACLSLATRDVLVVGGGSVALRKVAGLLRAGAQVTVVAPRVCRGLIQRRAKLTIRRRAYRANDLKDRWLVVAATGDPDVNRKISEDASRARIFCNVVDQPELCTFQVPAVMRRGRLQIGISTEGASPALARRIRRRLEKEYGPRYAQLLEALHVLRRHFQRKYPDDPAQRRKLLESFIESSAPALLLKHSAPREFRRKVERWRSL
jgi:precorrin-2 dehydrogenase/sirohydrochlorin ferrochelatase